MIFFIVVASANIILICFTLWLAYKAIGILFQGPEALGAVLPALIGGTIASVFVSAAFLWMVFG